MGDVSTSHENLYDAVIVGGGPAGLSAGVWLARYLHSVVLVDSGDPRNWETRGINGFLGQPNVRPAELRGMARDECRRYGVTLVDGCVERVAACGDERFELELADGSRIAGRRLLLAIGIRDIWPEIPGLDRCYGETAHVCPDCDGYEARGKRVVVVGTGRKAVGMALSLTTWTRDIVVCTNGDDDNMDEYLRGKLDGLGIPVLLPRIVGLTASDNGDVQALQLADSRILKCERIFFSIAQYPADDLGVQLGCERDRDGQIVVDDAYHTSVRNVFAAGDIVPGPQLAIAAASDGAIAALAIHKSLLPEERRLS